MCVGVVLREYFRTPADRLVYHLAQRLNQQGPRSSEQGGTHGVADRLMQAARPFELVCAQK